MKQKLLILIVAVPAIVIVGIVWYIGSQDTIETYRPATNTKDKAASTNVNPVTELTAADQAGKQLSANRCTGTAKPKLTTLPMRLEDFNFILPYGLVIGGHVTPIDHQYFSPTNFNSPPDTYDVYAMADSRIVDISTRTHQGQGPNKNLTVTDYRFVFTISCRLFYYYDLVTSLAPDIKAAFDAQGRDIDLPIQAGQLIGKIGGQTLDFAVWDTDRRLPGFIVPEHYTEVWKIFTVDPLDYYTDEVKAAVLSKYIRAAEPRSGKIDYDIDGYLIGNWFQVGTNGYRGLVGEGNGDYWTGHLSFAPYFLDPTEFLVSIGNWPGGAKQFADLDGVPDPATVRVDTGLVKYDLVEYRDYLSNGQPWDNMSFPNSPLTLHRMDSVQGCLLVQMTGRRSVKAEAFIGKSCGSVSIFTDAVVTYER